MVWSWGDDAGTLHSGRWSRWSGREWSLPSMTDVGTLGARSAEASGPARSKASHPSLAARGGAPSRSRPRTRRSDGPRPAIVEMGNAPDPLGRDRMPTSVIYSKDHCPPYQGG